MSNEIINKIIQCDTNCIKLYSDIVKLMQDNKSSTELTYQFYKLKCEFEFWRQTRRQYVLEQIKQNEIYFQSGIETIQ